MKIVSKYIFLFVAMLVIFFATAGSIQKVFTDRLKYSPNKTNTTLTTAKNNSKSLKRGASKEIRGNMPSKKESSDNFDVLFLYNLIKNCFSSPAKENEMEVPSSGLFITEALTLLVKQFKN